MRTVWICPSRNRPANIARLLNAWDDTRAQADLVVAVDDDDDHLNDYRELFNDVDPSQFILQVGPRTKLGPTLNRIAVDYAPHYDAVGFLGDDHIPRTPRWDQRLADVLDGGLAYGNDLFQGENLATAVLQSSRIITTLGQYHPPQLVHLYLDNYWIALGQGINALTYLPDVILEHHHFTNGKSPADETYAEANSPANQSNDQAAWQIYQAEQLPLDTAALTATA